MALAGREKSMSFWWFVLASLMIVLTIWYVYDEAYGRRTWKKYAAEWEQMETDRLQKAIGAAQKQLKEEEIKKIAIEREKLAPMLESDEFAQAQADVKEKKKLLYDSSQNLQFAKADQDELFYVWKHAQHEGHPFEEYKKQYDELEQKIVKLKAEQAKAEADELAAEEKLAKLNAPYKALEAKEAEIRKKISQLEIQLKAVKDRGAPIEQFILPDLGLNGPVIWGNVDRCTSCHIPTLKAGNEKNKNPFKTHPHIKEIFGAHPVEKYGCVTCHGGQGRATQILGKPLEEGDYTHGYEHHWLNPLLRGDFVQSSCNKCHVQQLKLDMAPVYTQGKQVFIEYGCINCHNVKGLDWAPKSGPDLSKIKDKVYPEWMLAWVKQPTNYLPHTKMPQVPWKDEKDPIKAMAYLLAKSEPFNWKYGNHPGGSVDLGKETFQKVGCIACHNLDGMGGGAAPALDKIAEKTNADWIYNWIREPKNWSHDARMPSLRLTPEEAANVTAYVISHGSKPAEDAALRSALSDPKNIEAGFNVINTYGCYACHNIKGFEGASKPSVELSNFGRKDVTELAFGDAKIPETWEAWTEGKLVNPQMYVDERSSSFMPKPNIDDKQRKALMVFLKGQRQENLPKQYIAYDAQVEKGRQLVLRYNCKSCHMIEGEGQEVSKWITEGNFLPPNLASAGARLQTQWMEGFLRNPGDFPKVRSWLNIRMPTFGFTDEEIQGLILYFKKIAKVDTVLEEKPDYHITPEYKAAAETLIGPNNFNCASCHIIGNNYPAAGPTVWAPNLEYVHERIRPQWLKPWISNPGDLIPGIRMPGYYPEPNAGPKDVLGGDDSKQIQALVDYLMTLGKPGAVVSGEPAKAEPDLGPEATESQPSAKSGANEASSKKE